MTDKQDPAWAGGSTVPWLRRRFLTLTAAATALAFTVVPDARASTAELRGRDFGDTPFTLGVASGDPLPDAVVLWTRLAPRPWEPEGGLPAVGIAFVSWEVAEDEQFSRVVRRGRAVATSDFGYSVHVDVRGLGPGRSYWYRFRAGPWISPTGRTRTTPAHG
ncbi:PhoD-like phosphatase N-terminal domain-containing protein, partial [Streptomyces klenkii]|uniref:PhoD-like phosphatase N-terminal domain-containing protein n=1 Tax=Streptomyces klenkii TaxID=1420899 RepID=UPI0033A70EC0